MPHLDLSEGFSWSSDFQLPGSSARQGDISSDESDDEIAKVSSRSWGSYVSQRSGS